ncbi:MAG: thioredoxin domain-containing protein [Anaerolineae bacterium]|nr:thioredoxin domain-containing protein [Anaerolineae bacterium]
MQSLRVSIGSRIAVAVLLTIAVLASGCSGEEATPPTQEPAASPTAALASPTALSTSTQASPISAQSGLFHGVETSLTQEGFPLLGDPDAPVTLIEFSDYQCPFCARHSVQTFPALVETYGPGGQVNFIFRDFPLPSLHPNATNASSAALCVAEQGPALFWQMHEELFLRQNQWASLPDPTGYFADLATEVGADGEVYTRCITSGRSNASIQASLAAGQALGIGSTPSFQFVQNETGEDYILVGAESLDTFTAWIEALLAGEAPPQPEAEEAEAPQLPYWASSEGLAPDPERPGYTLAGDQYKGDPEAALVVVEFTDFQCLPCRQHSLEVQPALDEEFVDTGRVMWVFKHMPAQTNPQAPVAAAAAECAAAQGRFWEMYELLFRTVDRWTQQSPDATLVALAQELGLSQDQFRECLDSRGSLEPVLSDMQDGQGVVSSTPAFIVLYGGQGRILRGSLPLDDFRTALQQMLTEAGSR